MISLDDGKVVLLKVVRRVSFEMRDVAISRRDVVEMADGSIWNVAHRRPEYWSGLRKPRVVAFKMTSKTVEHGITRMREFERERVGAEITATD
ncbi:hypothetical protein [Streptomyces sp. 4F14]|uniref:hypothetical protein n=1 Tax=Streptomyces sp. 4F14 TaxID=3394380 RepID=UPI003A8424D3